MPIGIAIGVGAAVGGISSFFGAKDKNRQAKSAVNRQNKYNKAVYEFQYGDVDDDEIGGEALRQYDFAVEGLEITKQNNEINLQFQEYQSVQRYNYDMGIRAYEFAQANRVYDASVSRALQQQSFNQLAEQAAIVDQDRLYHEQLIDLSLDETQTLLNYGAAAAGVGLKKRAARSAAIGTAQQQRVAALKATGATTARGVAGRSAARNVQGILAESGARQAAIVDKLMFDTEASDQELFKMNQQLVMDQVGFEFSRDSARFSDMAARNKIRAQALQAAINAEASIALKPEIAPPMPKPVALPRPEYQDVYKPKKPPKPMKNVAMTSNPFLAGLSGAIEGAQAGLSIASGIKNFNTPLGSGGQKSRAQQAGWPGSQLY
jgi:hypothetical protein